MKTVILLVFFCMLGTSCSGMHVKDDASFLVSDEKYLKNITQLTFQGDNGEAYFSPDGKSLIYQSNRDGYACDKIWIMHTDGTEKRMVSPDHGAHTCAFFFPDNKRIVFSSTSEMPGECPPKPDMPQVAGHVWPLYPYDIFSANIDGSGMQKLTMNREYDAEPIVSGEGKHIVFGSKQYGDFNVYIMNSDGSNVRRLTDRIGYDGGPWISPDGRKIVWRAWYPESREERALWRECMEKDYIIPLPLDLWIMNADGSDKKLLLRNGATNFAPSWHPDGIHIVFSSNMDDWNEERKRYGHNFELYIIRQDGEGLERLTHNAVFDGFPMFSPDGSKISFASNRNPFKPRATDIFIADWLRE